MVSKAIYITAMAVLGAGIGYFVTLSRSPVVAILLPLLFSLVGGAGGIFLVRQDLTQKAGRERLSILGGCIVALVGGAVLTSILVFSRNMQNMAPELTDIPGYKTLAPSEQFAVLEMRMVATLLGATEKEKVQLLARAARKETQTKISLDPPELVASKLEMMQPALASVTKQLDDGSFSNTDDHTKSTLAETRAIVQSSAYLFHLWSSTKLATTTYTIVNRQLDILNHALDNIIGDGVLSSPVLTATEERPPLLAALFDLRATMESQSLKLVSTSDLNPDAQEEKSILTSEGTDLLKILIGLSARDRPGNDIPELARNPPGMNGFGG